MKYRFWVVRSRWDYFAFIALIQWLAVAVAALFWAAGWAVGSLSVWLAGPSGSPVVEPFAITLGAVAVLALGVIIAASVLSWLTVLSTAYGSRHHEHLRPTLLYHLAAIFFGPIVGVHYLHRTGQEA